MKQITFFKYLFVALSLLIYFLEIESCSVKPNLNLTPPTTKIPKKFVKINTTPAPRRIRSKSLLKTPKVTEPALQVESDESRFTKYSQYAKSGFFIEIEETVDNKTRVYQMQNLAPIYGRNSTSKRSADAQNGTAAADSDVKQIYGAESNGGGGDETVLTEEDLAVQKDWEGDCLASHFRYCSSLKHITVMNVYNKTEGRGYKTHHMEMDCLVESIACLKNGWTVNRCQIICMSKCNKAMLQGYDSLVSYSGPCKYI